MQNLSDKIRGKQRIVLPGEGVSGSAGLFLGVGLFHRIDEARQFLDRAVDVIALATPQRDTLLAFLARDQALRSEERRVGKEGVRPGRSQWSPDYYNKTPTNA